MSSVYCLAILTILLHWYQVKTDVQITFQVVNYTNPSDQDAYGGRCEFLTFFGDECDPEFTFKAHITASGDVSRDVYETAGPFHNSKTITNVLKATTTLSSFPTMIEISLKIMDYDRTGDDLIAWFDQTILPQQSGRTRIQLHSKANVEILVDVECMENYYGHQCVVYCKPKDGHWSCDTRTGYRICTKPCEHGVCELISSTAVCSCMDNWAGEYCETRAQMNMLAKSPSLELPTNWNMDIDDSMKTAKRIKAEHVGSSSVLVTEKDGNWTATRKLTGRL